MGVFMSVSGMFFILGKQPTVSESTLQLPIHHERVQKIV